MRIDEIIREANEIIAEAAQEFENLNKRENQRCGICALMQSCGECNNPADDYVAGEHEGEYMDDDGWCSNFAVPETAAYGAIYPEKLDFLLRNILPCLLAELALYRQSEADGLLVRLPCEVGNTVYFCDVMSECYECSKNETCPNVRGKGRGASYKEPDLSECEAIIREIVVEAVEYRISEYGAWLALNDEYTFSPDEVCEIKFTRAEAKQAASVAGGAE